MRNAPLLHRSCRSYTTPRFYSPRGTTLLSLSLFEDLNCDWLQAPGPDGDLDNYGWVGSVGVHRLCCSDWMLMQPGRTCRESRSDREKLSYLIRVFLELQGRSGPRGPTSGGPGWERRPDEAFQCLDAVVGPHQRRSSPSSPDYSLSSYFPSHAFAANSTLRRRVGGTLEARPAPFVSVNGAGTLFFRGH